MPLGSLVPVCGRQLASSSCCCLEKDVKVKFKGLTSHDLAGLPSLARGRYEAGTPGLLFSIKFVFKEKIMAQIKSITWKTHAKPLTAFFNDVAQRHHEIQWSYRPFHL